MDIIITIGPASWSEEIVSRMIGLGVKCFRFPFAKETPNDHLFRCAMVKRLANELNTSVLTMVDLPGSKPRLNNGDIVPVRVDESYRISVSAEQSSGVDFVVDPPIDSEFCRPGVSVAIGDGDNFFHIDQQEHNVISGRFQFTGQIERRRAFLPMGTKLTIESFGPKDKEFAKLACGEFDWLALSFVNSESDISNARDWVQQELNWAPRIVAKIETLEGVINASKIADAADVVMVARGDLALQIGFPYLWRAQEQILRQCQTSGTYSIAATGFLDSFSTSGVQTRSEIIDVSSTLSLGADAIMLSAETTIGRYPVESVRLLRDIEAAYQSAIFRSYDC